MREKGLTSSSHPHISALCQWLTSGPDKAHVLLALPEQTSAALDRLTGSSGTTGLGRAFRKVEALFGQGLASKRKLKALLVIQGSLAMS